MARPDYTYLNAPILDAIRGGSTRLAAISAKVPAIPDKTPKQQQTIIDGRLQSLRNSGVIRYDTKTGWFIEEKKS